MTLKEHLAYGGIATAALYPHFGEKTLLFYAASVLIDTDHYIDFLYYSRMKDMSVKRMFQFHNTLAAWRNKPNLMALEAFHCAEFHLAILCLALYFGSSELLFIFSGLMFHMLLDLIRLSQWKRIDLRALSFVEYIIRKKRMIRSTGIHPESPYEDAYAKVSSRSSSTTALPSLQQEVA